jgi:4-hydroxyphenylpyruvate dioxygenase-like putative hemolysin
VAAAFEVASASVAVALAQEEECLMAATTAGVFSSHVDNVDGSLIAFCDALYRIDVFP